jgi:aspartate kinase
LIVTKFGGTSVQDAGCLARAASIVARQRADAPLVVVSAVAGVTRRLLGLGEAAASGADAVVARELAAIEALHRGVLHGIDPRPGPEHRALDQVLARVRDIVAGVAATRAYAPPQQDALISCGERLSAVLFGAAAAVVRLPVERVDAASVIITDGRFRHARPDRREIGRRAGDLLRPVLEAGAVPVIEGFIGATPTGEPTTMGFEASDLTASLLGAALSASQIQIWTDVPGMLTTGHPAVEQPLVVPRLSFDEAAELALFGAKVLHPDSIAPARESRIPVRILHSRNPGGEGTWIAAGDSDGGRPRVKSIAVTEDPADESSRGVRAALGREQGWAGRAVVCPVGEGIGSDRLVAEEITRLVGEVTVWLPLPRRPHAVPLVVPVAKVATVVRRLHDVFLAQPAGDL